MIKLSTRNIFSYIGLACILFYYQITDTVLSFPYAMAILLLGLFFFAFQYIITVKYKVKTLAIFAGCFLFLAYQYKMSNDSRLMVYVFALLGLNKIPIRNILKFILYEKVILIVFIIAVTALGVGFVPRTIEYTLGFIHGNLFMISAIEIFLLYVCLYWEKTGKIFNFVTAIMIVLTYVFSHSRTGLVLFFLSFFLFLHIKYGKTKHLKYLDLAAVVTPSVLFVVSITLPYLMSINWFLSRPTLQKYVAKMDALLSSRLTLGAIRLKYTTVHLFHTTTDAAQMHKFSYTVVDSGYVQLLLVFGILGSILFLCYYTTIIYKICKMVHLGKEKYIYLLSITIMCLNAFTENSLCSLKYNFTMLFIMILSEKMLAKNILETFRKGNVQGFLSNFAK